MTVREFVSQLQDALDRAHATKRGSREVVVTFIAPNSGFCGPTIRPKFLGSFEPFAGANQPGSGRYGLTRMQVERLLEAFHVTLPPEFA